jgi:hypothetical protein
VLNWLACCLAQITQSVKGAAPSPHPEVYQCAVTGRVRLSLSAEQRKAADGAGISFTSSEFDVGVSQSRTLCK